VNDLGIQIDLTHLAALDKLIVWDLGGGEENCSTKKIRKNSKLVFLGLRFLSPWLEF
jgi:hypothetical protein